jgi:hypothetical protein
VETTTAPDLLRQRRRAYKGVSWGVLLVSIGVILLLNTSGRLSWGVWIELLRLWPVLLISAGIRLIFAGTRAHALCLMGPALVAVTAGWVASRYDEGSESWRFPDHVETITLECAPGGVPPRLAVRFAGGRLILTGEATQSAGGAGTHAAESGAAGSGDASASDPGISGSLHYSGGSPSWTCDGGEAGLKSRGRFRDFNIVLPFTDEGTRWDAKLRSARPLGLRLDLAAASADIDLRSLILDRADIDSAASKVVLRLGSPRGRVPIRIQGALSRVRVVAPEGTCVTVTGEWILNVLDFDRGGSGRHHRGLSSPECGQAAPATPRYEIRYELPLSTVSVERPVAGA